MKEVWRKIKHFEHYYISNLGRVKSIIHFNYGTREKILKQMVNTRGYCFVNLYLNNKNNVRHPHRLVPQAFLPNPENYLQVNHIDLNKTNNHISNLEWCTDRENKDHYYKSKYGPDWQAPIKKKRENKLDMRCIFGNNHRHTVEIYVKDSTDCICFYSMSLASEYMGKKKNYISNWIHKNKLIYGYKNYNWVIKKSE